MKRVKFLIVLVLLLGIFYYSQKIRTISKPHIELPRILTEESCMKLLAVYQPDIYSLNFTRIEEGNFSIKQVRVDTNNLLPNGERTITFTSWYQKRPIFLIGAPLNNSTSYFAPPSWVFEGCNILETYTVESLTKEPQFKKYFDCEETECHEVRCNNSEARLFYTYRRINDYCELKYYMKELSPDGRTIISFQILYFKRPLGSFIKAREESLCRID